jgi:hypothetical protein
MTALLKTNYSLCCRTAVFCAEADIVESPPGLVRSSDTVVRSQADTCSYVGNATWAIRDAKVRRFVARAAPASLTEDCSLSRSSRC